MIDRPTLIVVDHYDSFTHNLTDLFYGVNPNCKIHLVAYNDPGLDRLIESQKYPLGIVLSAGPKKPYDAAPSLKLYQQYKNSCSFLGICLGHQIMGVAEGFDLIPTRHLNHGGTKKVRFVEQSAYFVEHQPWQEFATYNSLCLSGSTPKDSLLVVGAYDEKGEIAALESKDGGNMSHLSVQFHPESFLSLTGEELARKWLHKLTASIRLGS